jgi:energy-coupling factor transport system ATP-binding protein
VWVRAALSPRARLWRAGRPLHASALGYRHPGADRPAIAGLDVAVRGRGVGRPRPERQRQSTLALLLGGLLRPGAVPCGRPPSWPAVRRPRRRTGGGRGTGQSHRLGVQNPEHQFVTTRVADELALGPRRLGLPATTVSSTVDDLLTRLRLDRLAQANPYTLSGGEQRRLSVATALATAPRLLARQAHVRPGPAYLDRTRRPARQAAR